MIYIDTSAFLKLVKDDEAEGPALRAFLTATDDPRFVSSTLLGVEARRGTLRASPRRLPRVDLMLADVTMIDMTGAVLDSAGRLPDPLLRTLDAIHLATALLIRDDIDVLLTYDQHLLDAAAAVRIPTAAPS